MSIWNNPKVRFKYSRVLLNFALYLKKKYFTQIDLYNTKATINIFVLYILRHKSFIWK